MGNSGSAHSAVPNSDEHINYRHSPSQWSQSIPRDSTNRHSHQIKVLPELKGIARLRATNNGNILHGGGTISGRRDLVLHNGVFRTRSTSSTRSPDPSEQDVRVPHPPHPHRLMQRSQTQLNITRDQPGPNKLPENTTMKRFGSEPDLRGSGDERNDTQKGDSRFDKNNLPKAKLIRNKKKKAAPLPPIQVKANQLLTDKRNVNYDPSRFGWKRHDEKLPVVNKENIEEAPKKLRLFKTKAETQKVNEVTVVPKEIEKLSTTEKHQQNRYTTSNAARQSFNSLPYYHHDGRHQEFDRLSDHHDEREINVPPLPQRFRREKSFDLSLLMQQKELNSNGNSLSIKQLQAKTPKDVNNQRSLHLSSVESKLRSRKFSQPATSSINPSNIGETDFKKELLAATRRRSQNIVLKTKDEVPVITDSKSLNQNVDVEFEKNLGNKMSERSEKKPLDDDLRDDNRRSFKRHQVKDDTDGYQHQQLSETATKTFYFGMSKDQSMQLNEELPVVDKLGRDFVTAPNQFSELNSESTDSSLSSALIDHFPLHLVQTLDDHLNDPDSNPNGIQVNMRPALPRRQYEVPRFSPAAAWKLLAAQTDCDIRTSPEETTNVCEQQNFSSYGANDTDDSLNQQLLESRIERVYRDPVPGFPDNKSGDSGISGDAGLQERVESPTARNNDKIGPFLLPWTPLQDLGEESSSDEADMANSKEELTKLVNRGHVFSLSLPRESHLLGFGGESLQLADAKTFNSLQKLKRTVSSAFGGSNDSRERNKTSIYRNENWMLSRSAPNSIDNTLFSPVLNASSDCGDENDDFIVYAEERTEPNLVMEEKIQNNEYRSYNRRPRQQTQTEHSKILPPSFNYLTGGRHLMYLPNQDNASGYDEHNTSPIISNDNDRRYAMETNIAENRSLKSSSNAPQQKERENLQDPPELALNVNGNPQTNGIEQYAFKLKSNNSSKTRNHHRFTFQSTVRQIERRRLAERLSKDAEQKEAQRLSELEAMRRVEEEFQKKRAREKASIRHQLRLYSLGENGEDVTGYTTGHYTSLPIEWKSNGPRDEPDGAVSSPVPSPTSQNYLSTSKPADSEAYVDTKTPYISRIIEQKSGKLYRSQNSTKNIEVRTPPTEVLSEFHTTRREYVEYRNARKNPMNNLGKSGAHSLNHQQMTYKTSIDEPSDNYRKSFAHGRSICSSDSDMSGPIIRSVGRHKHRSRSPSPEL